MTLDPLHGRLGSLPSTESTTPAVRDGDAGLVASRCESWAGHPDRLWDMRRHRAGDGVAARIRAVDLY